MKKIRSLFLIYVIVLSSCTGFRPFDNEESIQILINEPSQVVLGEDAWYGTEDCSARAFLNRTSADLLFTIEVYDDSLKTGAPESYLNDGVELYFDFRPPRLRENNYYQKGVFQAVILPEPGKKQIAPIEWFPKNYDSGIPGTRAFTELRDSGYIVQVSIPYSSLKRNHYWPRTRFYMDVAVNDADTGRRESQIMWAGKRDNWNNPHNFQAVQFEDEEEKIINQKPNILLILTDRQTLRAMSAYGNQYLRTPIMDALAKYGVRFTKSYCTSPASSPSRSSLITGRMPHETGVNYNHQVPDSGLMNMGQLLQKEGYETIWAGKWHLADPFPHTSSTRVPGFRLLNFLDAEKISGWGKDSDRQLSEAVVKYLKSRKQKPFMLAVSFLNPHDIAYLPAKPGAFQYPANIQSSPPLPGNYNINPAEPGFLKEARKRDTYENEINLTKDFSDQDWRNYLHHYYRMTESVDGEIGKIINALESGGLDENTLIIFTSDHGEGAASHKWAGSLSLYEECITVPMIITWFGKTPENRINNINLVSSLDVVPTILDYAGIEPSSTIRGLSLKTVIEHPDTTWRNFVVTELAIDPGDNTKTGRMITDGRFKYIVFSHGRRNEQLFDLASDPGEKNNLAYSSAYISKKRELERKLKEWLRNTGDPFRVVKQE